MVWEARRPFTSEAEQMLSAQSRDAADGDLADHFLECARLGRYLTQRDGNRFLITDDLREGRVTDPVAIAAASIFSRDVLVAQVALLPLGTLALKGETARRRKYEQLFALIEAQAFSPEARESAEWLLSSGFRERRIRELESELGGRMSPARLRYRAFLDVVRALTERRVTPAGFRDEFLDFTYAVAGSLDFGIYSFCLDRIFGSERVPLQAKALVAREVLKYPPIMRRELISNLLVVAQAFPDLVEFVRREVKLELPQQDAVEIFLLETLKSSQLSMGEIERMVFD